jgi:phage portal protein BeeE
VTSTRFAQRKQRKNFSASSIGQTFNGGNIFASSASPFGMSVGAREDIGSNFESYVEQAYKANGIVFACILARLLVFSEARFLYQEMLDGRPGKFSSGAALNLLETPWPNGTTGELLARMEQDASLAGNFFATPRGSGVDLRLRRLRPDWVTIVTGSPDDDPFSLDATVLGYLYKPRGTRFPKPAQLLLPRDVVHYSPIPDPIAQWRGMSWLTPVLREIEADSAATRHKSMFFKHGATSNLVVVYDKDIDPDAFKEFVAEFKQAHDGVENAYKTIHLGGGADANTIGADMKQLDFKATQGAGETRIAAASGVGAIIAQFSEGMAGSSLNEGNYSAARRRFADGTIRPNWRIAAASLAKLVDVPTGKRLWYFDRDIPFLREDAKDAAEIMSRRMLTVESGLRAGFKPESVVAAVDADDLTLLEHTGLFSVQLHSPSDGVLDEAGTDPTLPKLPPTMPATPAASPPPPAA